MFSASHTDFKAFERYILSDKKLDEALKMLVEGSDAYQYLRFLHIFNERGQMSNDEKAQFNDFIKNSPNASKDLELRQLFIEYDNLIDQDSKAKLLDKIAKNYLQLRFEDPRPEDLPVTATSSSAYRSKELNNQPFDKLKISDEYARVYSGELNLSEIVSFAIVDLDFTQLHQKDFELAIEKLGVNIGLCNSKEFYKALVNYLTEQYKKAGKYSLLNEIILHRMTLQQLEKIKELLPSVMEEKQFVWCFFEKKFFIELSPNHKNLSLKEKRSNLIKMYEFASSFPPTYSNIKSWLLLEILENGLQQDLIEEKYFNEYLKTPIRSCYCKKMEKDMQTERPNFLNNVLSPSFKTDLRLTEQKDREILSNYLDKMFRAGRKIANYSDFLEKNFLIDMWEESQMMEGKKIEVRQDNALKLEQIKELVLTEFCKHNKDVFKIGEDIELFAEIKNVPSLIVKVFIINAENYYRDKFSAFKADINLDGFVATIEHTINYQHSPTIRHREVLKFPEIKGKSGLFVIELIGNGKSARAIIKIGSLSVVTKPTIAGLACFIFDSEHKICANESTGILAENTMYKVDPADTKNPGRILLPYPKNSYECPAILIHESLAQVVKLYRNEETYSLQCGFFMYPEALIMGNKATVLIRPQLLINDRKADIRLLENPYVVMNTRNFIDDIPATKVFEGLELDVDKEIEIPFTVIPHMKFITVEFHAEVKRISIGDKIELQSKHKYRIETHEHNLRIEELHFRCVNPGPIYEILLLGKNGEPVPHTLITVKFKCDTLSHFVQRQYLTDSAGIIKIGKLEGVTYVQAEVYKGEGLVSRDWMVPSRTLYSNSSKCDLLEDELLEIPMETEKRVNLIRMNAWVEGQSIEDLSANLKYIKKEAGKNYGILKIEGLKEGLYYLKGVKEFDLKIQVHKGQPFEGCSIIKEDSFLDIPERNQYIRIKSLKVDDKDPNNATISVQMESNNLNQCHAHLILYNFLGTSLNLSTNSLLLDKHTNLNQFKFQNCHNFYMSNQQLSSELSYCIDRRQMPKLTGSMIDKPTLLLKNALIGKTTSQAEQSQVGSTYEKTDVEEVLVEPSSIVEYPKEDHPYDDGNIVEYQNFLVAPNFIWNAVPDSQGLITAKIDKTQLRQASGIYVVGIGQPGVTHYLHPLFCDKFPRKDLSLQQPFEKAKNYSEVRLASGIEKNKSHVIEDITSTHFVLIDSLSMVYDVLENMNKLFQGHKNNNLWDFRFLIKWLNKSKEEKLKLFSKFMSHEFNLFLYKKDPEFFKTVVMPFLANKMEKGFIDKFLLDLPLNEYLDEPSELENLNILEETLLVQSLVSKGQIEIAKTIASLINSRVPEESNENAEEENKIFDTVLTQNALKDKKTEIEQAFDEAAQEAQGIFHINFF